MKRLILLLSFFATSVLAQTNVPISNPSFETYTQTGSGSGCGYNVGPIPGWTASGSFGQAQCDSTVFTSSPDSTPTIAYSSGATITQDLGVATLAVTYTMTAYVGHRLDGFYTGSTATIALFSGATSLCSQSVLSASGPAGGWQAVTLSCPATASSNHLIVSLGCAGGQCQFDDVSLTYPSAHSAVLTWTDTVNPTGTTWKVYRSPGAAWNPVLLSTVTVKNYTDTTVVPGQNYVYKITALNNGVESDGPSAVTVSVQ